MAGGSWVGALASGYISDKIGRKRAIQFGSIWWIIGSIIVCASQNIAMLIVGRIINGFAVGICSAQVPVYLSEIAPPTIRGRLVACQQWSITWGILILFYISYGTSFIDGPAAFRIPWGIQMVPAVILLFALQIVPESPRWLARNGRWDESLNVLALVHASGNKESPAVMSEMEEIRASIEFEIANDDVSIMELFHPNMINRTHIGIFTQIWSQLTGMNVMMYYITYIFAMAGMKGSTLLVSSSIQYIINVVMTIPALLFLDKWGRRPPLVIGAILMMICLFTNAGVIHAYSTPAPPGGLDGIAAQSFEITGKPAKVVIAFSYLFVASFAPTWGPTSWVYVPELFPLRVRGKAGALCTSANWAFNFALGYFVPVAFQNIGWEVYIIFGVFCAAMAIHVFFLFPETAGKSLEDIESMFVDPKGIKYLGTPAWRTGVVGQLSIAEKKGEESHQPNEEMIEKRESGGTERVADEEAATKETAVKV
jgi:sugar porter (SP) family MFS transporter